MATSEQDVNTDPITAALPPNSDYLTYLTILEYQLTPERLPILTKHLAEDDGTLAKEIGWDLVKLVLPLLNAAPKDAAKCLEVVARRGNPREVVVRVAEALETIGAEDGGIESELDQDLQGDALPTMEGEAPRIHLGEMKLQGMPQPVVKQEAEGQTDAPDVSDSVGPQFSTLLTMLGSLHPRIKTQYPSRFLVTSLPAALGAYRRIPITSETTTSFLTLLGKLSGKQRPTLPPRSSTASVTRIQPTMIPGTEVHAPLPDPEGQSEENSKAPSDHEMSLVLRLLQAVTLEVLEEYLLADSNTMEWATRLLEKQSSTKVIPDRKMRSKAWQDDENLRARDSMMNTFLRLAKDLQLNPEGIFRHTNLPLVSDQSAKDQNADTSPDKDEDEEPSEFPTSPSQIPCSHLGALFLFLAGKAPAAVYSDENISSLDISIPDLHHFVNQFVVPTPIPGTDHLIPSVTHNQPSAIDALLALLFLTSSPPKSSATTTPTDEDTDTDYKSIISILSYLSAEHPDPSFRTSAHHLATTLLHNHPSSGFRLETIKSTMTDCGPFENLKEIAIGWLKEEILFTLPQPPQPTTSTSSTTTSQPTTNIFASPTLFSTDETLTSLIFPENPITPPSSSQPETPNLTTPIATLNLLYLLLTNPTLQERYPNLPSALTAPPKTSIPTNIWESRASHFLHACKTYIDEHAGKMANAEEEGRLGLLGVSVGRVVGAVEAWERESNPTGPGKGE